MTSIAELSHRRLEGQTIVVLGGTSGIGLETARRVREAGADVILTARDPERLHQVGLELSASIAAFDLGDAFRLARFFDNLPRRVDHVLVSGAGPHYATLRELDPPKVQQGLDRIVLSIQVARLAIDAVRSGGSLTLIGGTGGRRPAAAPLISAVTAAIPALVRSLALELAPIRVNGIAPGFVDTPLSAAILGDELEARRDQLRNTLPIRRVIGAEEVADLAVYLMTNTAITGATYDIDGGQQLVET